MFIIIGNSLYIICYFQYYYYWLDVISSSPQRYPPPKSKIFVYILSFQKKQQQPTNPYLFVRIKQNNQTAKGLADRRTNIRITWSCNCLIPVVMKVRSQGCEDTYKQHKKMCEYVYVWVSKPKTVVLQNHSYHRDEKKGVRNPNKDGLWKLIQDYLFDFFQKRPYTLLAIVVTSFGT